MFFEPGKTYTTDNGYTAPELVKYFRCEAVATHPAKGALRAFGFGWYGHPGIRRAESKAYGLGVFEAFAWRPVETTPDENAKPVHGEPIRLFDGC